MIENFNENLHILRDYDSQLSLKILNKTLFGKKKLMIENYLQMKTGKLIQKIIDNKIPSDNSNLKRILSDFF